MDYCPLPWRAMLIDIDGDVRVCCFNSVILGNLHSDSVASIWNNEKYQELRRRLKENDFSCGCSNDCPNVISIKNAR